MRVYSEPAVGLSRTTEDQHAALGHDGHVEPGKGVDERPAYQTPNLIAKSTAEVAVCIALFALLLLGMAFVTGFSVVDSTEFANRFENGQWPLGTDLHGMRLAARLSAGSALAAVVSMGTAAAIRISTAVIVIGALIVVGAMFYLPIGLVTMQVAF